MNTFTRRVRPVGRIFFDIRIITGILGVVLSVALHEMVHLVVHAGNITNIAVLPNNATLVEITAIVPHGYSTNFEEFLAYSATFVVLIFTVVLIARQTDKKDVRSFKDTLLPKHSPLQKLSNKELFELAAKTNLL